MGHTQPDRKTASDQHEERPCWREILFGALAGFSPYEGQIEAMLDHLERTK